MTNLLWTILLLIGLVNAQPITYTYKYALETPVNIRSGKGTNYEIIGKMTEDERFEMDASCKSGWCKARARGIEGWVHISQAKPKPTKEITQSESEGKGKGEGEGEEDAEWWVILLTILITILGIYGIWKFIKFLWRKVLFFTKSVSELVPPPPQPAPAPPPPQPAPTPPPPPKPQPIPTPEQSNPPVQVYEAKFVELLRKILQERGPGIFDDAGTFRAIFLDYGKNEHQREIKLLVKVLEKKIPKRLLEGEISNRKRDKAMLAKILNDDEGIDINLANGMLNCLCHILFNEPLETTDIKP